MSVEIVTLLFVVLLLTLLVMGLPISFCLGGLAMIFIYFLMGPQALFFAATRLYGQMQEFIIVCIPLFIFMGVMLERSGVADDLFKALHMWSGRLRGGLAVATVLICMMMAAMTGLSGAAVVTMGLIALPAMLSRNYDKSLALGCIGGGGALGILIPPSVTMVVYALIAEQSVGKLFMGGILPGILLGSLFIIYIFVRCALQPHLAPALPPEERGTWTEKVVSMRSLVLPIALIVAVLGSIFAGIATPTEAAGVGAFGTIVCAAIYRRLTWQNLREAAYRTLTVSAMAMWIYIGALSFATLYQAIGSREFVAGLLLQIPGGKWGVIIAIQLIWLVLGMFLDPWGIIMITAPIFCPLVEHLGFDLVWFGVLFIVNMEMAYLTPPFGFNLFYLKGVAPPGITLADLYRSVFPFILCQLIALVLVMLFPQLVLWIPSLMLK